MTIKSGGNVVYRADGIHKIIFIKNLLDYSDDYPRSTAKKQFWYLDTNASNVTAAAATNAGIRQRGLLSHGGLTVETMIPLNRFSFFEELNDRLLPPMHLQFQIVLQDDNEMIFQNDGTGRRIVVRLFELWVPQLTLSAEGQKMFNENFLKPAQWTYLKETLQPSQSTRDARGSWLINAGVKNAKHVFIFFQQTRKNNSLEHNPYIFDTFNIDGDDSAKLSHCELQYGKDKFPLQQYNSDFKLRILKAEENFRYRKNDYNTGTQPQVANFENHYPFIYFDLRPTKEFDFSVLARRSSQCTILHKLRRAPERRRSCGKTIGNELVIV